MFGATSLSLLHWSGSGRSRTAVNASSALPQLEPIFNWSTCLRTIQLVEAISESEGSSILTALSDSPPMEVLHNELAYQRILEIICGLHSPLIGETEVLGQFKQTLAERIEQLERSDGGRHSFNVGGLKLWGRALLSDAKEVRTQFLRDLGSQSYGSLVRREIRAFRDRLHGLSANPEVIKTAVIGGGLLAQEVVPWLMKSADGFSGEVPLLIRNPERPRDWVAERPGVRPCALNGPWPESDVFVIAAPISAASILEQVNEQLNRQKKRPKLLIDLRGEGSHDPIPFKSAGSDGVADGIVVAELATIFQSMQASRVLAESKRAEALEAIRTRSSERFNQALHRPFGWDDVWS